jgi:hypothetical protein
MRLYKQIDNRIELCIFPWLEKEIRKLFAAEIEQGSREVLDDGRLYFVFHVSEEKASLLHWISDWAHCQRCNGNMDTRLG